jgi:hypothetical protein
LARIVHHHIGGHHHPRETAFDPFLC